MALINLFKNPYELKNTLKGNELKPAVPVIPKMSFLNNAPNASTPTGPVYIPPPTAPVINKTIQPPVAPATPVVRPAVSERPDVPVTSTGEKINPSTGGIIKSPEVPNINNKNILDQLDAIKNSLLNIKTASETPVIPNTTTTPGYEAAAKAYESNIPMTPEEEATQTELTNLLSSTRLGVAGKEGQGRGIPLDLIRGQQAKLEKQGLLLSEPLSARMSLLQAKRTAALNASKFKLEQESGKLSAIQTSEKEARTEKQAQEKAAADRAVIDRKFEEDKRQFGLEYALKQKQVAIDQQNANTSATKNKILSIADAEKLGVPYGTTQEQATALGKVPGVPAEGANVSNQLQFLIDTADKAKEFAGSSGQSGLRRSITQNLFGASEYTNLVSQVNTLKTNMLTLATDPNIKKFFGPQMSNADVVLMMSGGTTLNPEGQDPETLKSEIVRLKDRFVALKQIADSKNTKTSTMTGTLPDGTVVTKNADGSITDAKGNKYDENGNKL